MILRNTHRRSSRLQRCGIIVTLALTIGACSLTGAPEEVRNAASQPLMDTTWRLATLNGQVLVNPSGPAAVTLQLQSANPRLTGFAGCNRLFGGYLLNGEQLKVDQVGATKMACADETRTRLEQDYLQMLSQVTRWKIEGSSLALLGADATTLATFTADETAVAR